jgi:RNA polymerase sigma-70 factor, ECF subfamily
MEIMQKDTSFRGIIAKLELFIDDNQDKFVHHAFFRLGNISDAEEIVQDMFVKIYNELKNGKNILNLSAYAYRLITNACIDKLRANRNRIIPIQNVQETEIGIVENPENELIRFEEYKRINKLLDLIPEEQAEIVRFRIVDGMPFKQIANILELPLTTVKSRFSYGIQKIKTQYFNQKEVTNVI